MGLDLAFDPHLPLWAMIALSVMALAVIAVAVWRKATGVIWRALVALLIIGALFNPVIIDEERDALNDVAALVIDQSASQDIGDRKARTQEAASRIRAKLEQERGLETRVIEVGTGENGTEAIAALQRAMADVPPDRIAGAVLVTDGQVHDIPESMAGVFDAPVHALITGHRNEADRKLTLSEAPRFGIVGESVTLKLRVDDFGTAGAGEATLVVRIDGEERIRQTVQVGRNEQVPFELPHGGENVVEVEVDKGPQELTLLNNRAVAVVNGIRDRLRVLLISGEPHAGERTWRNLLKADPAVDLVHFTILRPPEKQDDTPIDELSLIAFPTRELFVEKLNEFDLIIFDRYRRRAILPSAYYANIANYLQNGGAILVSSGPDYASPLSIYRTALGSILPARPTGDIIERGYKPEISNDGAKHPVTSGLVGANADGKPPSWGRWFRLVDTERLAGRELMTGPDGRPLLILDRVGQGRVALLLSDHAWLWTRGVEGGGPQAELLRRLAHWLMKEPDLEEERLRGTINNGELTIERRTMADTVSQVAVTLPSGQAQKVEMKSISPGRFEGSLGVSEPGLYRLQQDSLTAVAASGSLNAREFADVRATDGVLKPVADATAGHIFWLDDVADPDIRMQQTGSDMSGSNWLGLRANNRYVVRAVSEIPLLHPALAMILILATLLWAWRRESR